MYQNKILKNVFFAVAVAGFGMLMLYFALMLDYFFNLAAVAIIGIFGPPDVIEQSPWFGPLIHFSYLAIIGTASWLVFKSKLMTLYKAIYLPVPVTAVSITIGMFFYAWPIVVYALNAFFYAGIFYYFNRTKVSWLYYYAVILVCLALTFLLVTGGEG